MPNIRLRVYNTQNNDFEVDTDVTVTTFQDIKDLIGFDAASRYTDKADRTDPFLNLTKLVTNDVTVFRSPAKSKAGMPLTH